MPNIVTSAAVDTFMQSADTAAMRTNAGLGNVNNTSDVNKPVSTAQATADALVASNASAALTAGLNTKEDTITNALALPAAGYASLDDAIIDHANEAAATKEDTITNALALPVFGGSGTLGGYIADQVAFAAITSGTI